MILKPENMCKVVGKEDHPEIPIWEHYKRHSRYIIRPLIEIGDQIYWGPYSAMKTGILWSGSVGDGVLPVDLEEVEISECLLQEKALVEKELVKISFEIVKKHTTNCENNVFLHKRDKNKKYPDDLGDYDVLAYFETSNVVLNVECKHLKQVFALKDARDLKEELFGRNKLNGSHVGKIVKRHDYLESNWRTIFDTLKWKKGKVPKVVSVFCSKQPYFWTFSPPIEVPVSFLCVNELDIYISGNLL